MAWTNPGGISFPAFTGYAQLFGKLCLNCKNRELADWKEDTLKEMMRWASFMEELREAMQAADVVQAQHYLDDPASFVQTGFANDVSSVVEAGLNCKILNAAGHFLLRNLLKNPHLSENLPLFKVVLLQYLSMVDDPSERPEAAAFLVRDLEKEVSHGHLMGKFLAEGLAAHAATVCFDEVGLSPRCVFDEEVRLFVLRPGGARLFGLSRALVPALDGLAACERSVQMCRKCPELLEVLLLCMVPAPLCFASRGSARKQLAPRLTETLVSVLLKQQHALSLWNSIDSLILMKVAAESETFASEWQRQ